MPFTEWNFTIGSFIECRKEHRASSAQWHGRRYMVQNQVRCAFREPDAQPMCIQTSESENVLLQKLPSKIVA